MPAAEFYEWFVYEQIEPFGDRRADLLAGIISAVIANVNRSKNTKAYTVKDFMPNWDPDDVLAPRKGQTAEEQVAILEALQQQMERAQNNG